MKIDFVISWVDGADPAWRKEKYKYIPVIVMVCGGLIGLICYLVDKNILMNANNVIDAIVIGISSGSVSVSSNHVIKQFIKKE